jgi:5,10-methylenetetrahydromethanopterin reductase
MTQAPSPVRFGINFLPHRARELLDWVKAAEDTGFAIAGVADSQSLYRDVYVCEALVATNTSSIRFGARVINPLTRHPAVAACAAATLEELAPGRTMLGVGTGDSAVDNIGIRPATLAQMREYVRAVRELLATGRAQFNGTPCKLTWWNGARIPIYLAASGPKTLQLAGEIADGVVINTGLTPDIIRDSIAQVRVGCERAGRDLSAVDMWWLPLTCVDDDYARALDKVAPTLASAGSHLTRLATRGKHVPPELMEKVKELGRRYNSAQHDMPQSGNRALIKELGLIDYLADRFAVIGSARDCIAKLEQAAEAGARQFWMSVHFDDKIGFMRQWAAQVMPAFK